MCVFVAISAGGALPALGRFATPPAGGAQTVVQPAAISPRGAQFKVTPKATPSRFATAKTPAPVGAPLWYQYAFFALLAAVLVGVSITYITRRYRDLRDALAAAEFMHDRAAAEAEALRKELEDAAQRPSIPGPALPEEDTPGIRQPKIPDIPDDLVEALASGNAVLFAGSSLGEQAGLPSWAALLQMLIKEVEERDTTGQSAELYRAATAKGNLDEIAQLLAQDLTDAERWAIIAGVYSNTSRMPPVYRDLAKIPFAYAITTSFNDLLEKAFRPYRKATVVTGDGERLDDALRAGTVAVIKLYGDVDDATTIRFTGSDYRNALAENPTFAKTVSSLALARTVFYVGSSAEEVQAFLADSVRQRPDRPHYALIPENGKSRVAGHLLTTRYNVTLLPFVAGPQDSEVAQFVRRLRERVDVRRQTLPPVVRSGRAAPEDGRIKRVALTNIGPFRDIAFDLNQHWNVVLGINGAGKSTILKAIALCLCGDDPDAILAAQQLLNTEADKGSIALTIGTATYRSELMRERGRVKVTANRLTPLQRGSALALGFPALRASSPGNPKGPVQVDRQWPEAEDLLPLLDPAADRRLGSFKQWIVNLVARAAAEPNAELRAKIEHSRDISFLALQKLSGNATVRFARVDNETWRVLVATPDAAELPLDLVSQGMTSLLAWIGVTLERFSEVNPTSERPEEEVAVLLIDEIDAHLHPSWQRELIGVLRSIFPNTQVIATTHSPLIVGGMLADEVFVSRRKRSDPKAVELESLQVRFKGLRVDQILASAAFDMPNSREPESAAALKEYESLVYKTQRTREEELRLKALSDDLEPFFFAGVTEDAIAAEERDAETADDPEALLNKFLSDDLSPVERQAVLDVIAKREQARVVTPEQGQAILDDIVRQAKKDGP